MPVKGGYWRLVKIGDKKSLKSVEQNLLRLVDLGKYQVVSGQLEKRVIVAECKDALEM